MYIHLGQNVVIKTSEVVGIFDLDSSTISKYTRDFLKTAQKTGKVVDVTTELPKTFVVCGEGEDVKVYISQISSQTLQKRAGFIDRLPKLK